MVAVQRGGLWASTAHCSQALLASKSPGGDVLEPGAFFEVADGELDHGVVAMEPVGVHGGPGEVGQEGEVPPAELIAAGHGVAVWQVRLRLRADGIRRPNGAPRRLPPSSPAGELRRFYVEEGWTLAELVAHYRTGRPNVRAWLDEAGVPVAPRTTRAQRRRLPGGAGGSRPPQHRAAARAGADR